MAVESIEKWITLKKQSASTTVSGVPVQAVYTDADLEGFDPHRELGQPGRFPYTRGVHESMYRDRLWTIRQFAGFGQPADTNRRFRFLLDEGQTGLSTAFDLPTLMGLDSDDPRSAGEVGRLGVAVDTIDDMLALFDQIDLNRVSVSMTINAPAIVIMAFYLAAARRGDSIGAICRARFKTTSSRSSTRRMKSCFHRSPPCGWSST